jgi:hypothetical protein
MSAFNARHLRVRTRKPEEAAQAQSSFTPNLNLNTYLAHHALRARMGYVIELILAILLM